MAEGPGPQEHAAEPASAPSAPTSGASPSRAPLQVGAKPVHELARLDPEQRASTVARLQGVTGNALLARRLQRDPAPTDPAAPAAPPAAPTATPAAGCIVDDAVDTLEPHQLHRGQVLSALRAAAGAAAEAALATSPWAAAARGRVTSELEALFATYAAQDAAALERSLRAAAPGAGAATSASAIVGAVAAEVGRSVGQALPKDDPLDAGISAVGGVASSVMNLLFKRRRGGRRPAADPVGTLGELGRGQALSGSERGRMEEAFGTSFADVRVHTDSVAADLAGQSDARAFSIGRSIAFGAGEYRPGTLEGDALIAHELAHVVQQRDGASDGAAAARMPADDVAGLEADADSAAIDAAVGLHMAGKGGLAGLRRMAVARMRSGIALRSCGSEKKPEIAATQEALGQSVKSGMEKKANANNKTGTSGLHYWFNYEKASRDGVAGYQTWKADWQFGHTAAPQFRKEGPFTWRMKPGGKASEALKAWLGGLTIADCASVAVALQHDAIRAAIGDAKFDDLFKLNLLISQYSDPETNPDLAKYLADTGSSKPQVGDLYYFANHKHYKYKHPAGAWQGENAIYAGNGMWSGFGAADVSEETMNATILSEYNSERTKADMRQIEHEKGLNKGVMPPEYVYGNTVGGSVFKETLTDVDEVKAGGGGLAKSGLRVDASKVAPKVPK